MHLTFFSSGDRFDVTFADAWQRAATLAGDTFIVAPARTPLSAPVGDVAIVVGIAHQSRALLDLYRAAGKHWLLIDKGYLRPAVLGKQTPKYWRVSLGAQFPTAYLSSVLCTPDRWQRLNLSNLVPMRTYGKHILICAPTHKSFRFQGLGDPLDYFADCCRTLRVLTDRPIRYRARQEEGGARLIDPLPGVTFADPTRPIAEDLRDAWVVVTHSTSAGVDAILAGIPVLELGEGIVKSIAERDITRVNDPYCPTEEERAAWCAALAWQQWTVAEMASGQAWCYLRKMIKEEQ